MKTTRGDQRDFDALKKVHVAAPFDLETLVERYRETWVTGTAREFKIKFVVLVEELFGPEAAARLEARLPDE